MRCKRREPSRRCARSFGLGLRIDTGFLDLKDHLQANAPKFFLYVYEGEILPAAMGIDPCFGRPLFLRTEIVYVLFNKRLPGYNSDVETHISVVWRL